METPLSGNRRLTWTQALLVVFGAALIGAGLGWWQPIWLAPPNFHYTPLMYLVIELLWVPLLVILSRQNLAAAKHLWISCLTVLIMLGVVGITLVMTGGQAFFFMADTPDEAQICRTEILADHQVRYTCQRSILFGVYQYTLEGDLGSPFAHMVEYQALHSL